MFALIAAQVGPAFALEAVPPVPAPLGWAAVTLTFAPHAARGCKRIAGRLRRWLVGVGAEVLQGKEGQEPKGSGPAEP
ncbi:hypothetical protein GCM10023088_37140 [Actinomadura verrucosospora]